MNKKLIKKILLFLFLGILLATTLTSIYINFDKLPNSLDNRLRDYFFTIRGSIKDNGSVVIIDVDEASLAEVGQWPWSRPKVSELLEKLTQANTAIIAFDMVFAEPDKSSPHRVFKKYNINVPNPPNYDKILGETVSNTPTILGYVFEFNKDEYTNKKAPTIPAIFIEKNKHLGDDYLLKAQGTILNVPEIQDLAYSSGFFNNIPDESGIIRSVPLLISYNNLIYPSLALEIMRVITQTQRVIINYDEFGVESIKLNNITIPTDRYGRLLLNFRGGEKTFKYYSAKDVLNGKISKKELEGKIAIIGTSAAGLLDLRATPFDSVYPGVEVHANVIDNILEGDFLSKPSWVDGVNIWLIFLLSIVTVLFITFTPFWLNPIISLTLLGGTLFGLYQAMFKYGLILNIFFPVITIVLGTILVTLVDYFYEIKKEEAIKKKFASKVSKSVMDNLLKNIDSNEFQAMEKEVTIFFSDVRGFTNISEQMGNAKELIQYLNEYMEPMSNIITKYEGTIDKYIGDAIMAYWNAPANVVNHQDKAVQAALAQLRELETLNKKLSEANLPLIDIGIGINTGLAIVGEMGSIGRSDYTVIGDPINLGSRLESLCKYYNSRLNISNYTKEKLKDEYIFRFLDLVTVKGKKEPVEIWQVLEQGKPNKELKEELDCYQNAIDLYKNSKFSEALKLFRELEENENKTNKNIYNIYINRCEEYIKTPPENFNGVYKHKIKG
ncbi:CHASE2 domain-containing protein [Halarcobacter ebronensis]|uniref:Adenylate/guanylate cyclase domain-containing protein n=1 Tax=Halarcobacter ebronensis TaxID=1462615 RepID=A0A4Q1AXH7_9BACT|nr:adenylate/guanylate cyclase domain-containing protein [Halarcobacter ebronensis]QKF82378.1 CHASE2 sensor-containing adenylate/guanylate cyclase [Halarcobacter ebronensis]RXK07596.1 adenylate/guanylate cyclase domain-containing protein [Halarcobacter ebronensis]